MHNVFSNFSKHTASYLGTRIIMAVIVILPRLSFCFHHFKIILELLLGTALLTLGILVVFWCFDGLEEVKEEQYFQFIPDCSCWRPFLYPPLNRTRLKSSCSDEASHFEPRQKVVSFFFKEANSDVYRNGIVQNLEMVQKYYPNFSMRVYTNVSLSDSSSSLFCQLLCDNRQLHWCDIGATPSHGNLSKMPPSTWRYLPLGDPTVHLFLSRDLDALISEREATTVQDWFNFTRKGFQLMRDHKYHHQQPILGGLWAANNLILGSQTVTQLQNRLISQSERQLSKNRRKSLADYQDFLTHSIFKMHPNDIVAYDSYHCNKWGKLTRTKAFPVRRKDNVSDYVGWKPSQDIEELEPCPLECRPVYARNWEFC